MNLESNRLLYTELQPADVHLIHRLNSYGEVARFNTIGIPQDSGVTASLLQPILDDLQQADRRKYAWIIRSKENESFIGQIGLNLWPLRYSRGEIYFSFLPIHWGQGFASEAAKRLIDFSFDTLNLHRVQAGAAVENHASIRVLEKVGMTREGMGRKVLPLSSGWQDNYEYSILEGDPR